MMHHIVIPRILRSKILGGSVWMALEFASQIQAMTTIQVVA